MPAEPWDAGQLRAAGGCASPLADAPPRFASPTQLSPPAAHGDVLALFGGGKGKVNTEADDTGVTPHSAGAAGAFADAHRDGDGDGDDLAVRRSAFARPPGGPLTQSRAPPRVARRLAQAAGGADGYSWRQCGAKSAPGVAQPRSSYKCSVAGCSAKKQARALLLARVPPLSSRR